jgi:hypothetical protein
VGGVAGAIDWVELSVPECNTYNLCPYENLMAEALAESLKYRMRPDLR